MDAAEKGQRRAEIELGLKVQWHATELEHRDKVRDARREGAKAERRALAKREAAVKAAQVELSSREQKIRMDTKTLAFFETLMKAEHPKGQEYLALLIADQLTTLRNKSGRVVWHTKVLEWCTDIYRRDPGAYEIMVEGGFLKLPVADTCRRRAAKVQATSGECKELFERLKTRTRGFSPARREMALLFDEINIVGTVAFKIQNGEWKFYGFVDIESYASELYVTQPKEVSHSEYMKKQVATHALVFQVAELSGEGVPRFRQVVGIHGVTSLNAKMLHRLFWRTVRNLYLHSDITIVVNISDGASCNRLFQKMCTHRLNKGTSNTYQSGKAWCINPFVPGGRMKLWFMSDPAHWVKKVVTHWEKSKVGGTRHLQIPDHLVQVVLRRCPPPINLVPQQHESGKTVGEEWYCRVLGRCYSLMAATRQPYYRGLDDERLQELRDILALVRAWHEYNAQLPNLTAKERSSRGFSHQLFWDTQIMIEGFLGLLDDLHQRHGSFVVRVRMLNQDSLESLFGRIRMACGSGNDPSLLKMLQAVIRAEDVAETMAGIKNARVLARTNSGQAGGIGVGWAPPAAGKPGTWIDRLRIVLPHAWNTPGATCCPFGQMCARAIAPGAAPVVCHPVFWETLRNVQGDDEKRQQAFGAKLMYWLTTSKHINRTGFSRMRVGLAIAVLSGPHDAAMMADVLQLLRYEG